jgi:hypothetical protein
MKRLLIASIFIAAGFAAPVPMAFADILLGAPQWLDDTHFDLSIKLVDVPPDNDILGVQGHIAILNSGFQLLAPTEFGPTQPAPVPLFIFLGSNPGEPLAAYFGGPATFKVGDLFILHVERTDPTQQLLQLSATVEFSKSNDEIISFALPADKGNVDLTTTIPEPGTTAVMIAGLGLLALVCARRRRG